MSALDDSQEQEHQEQAELDRLWKLAMNLLPSTLDNFLERYYSPPQMYDTILSYAQRGCFSLSITITWEMLIDRMVDKFFVFRLGKYGFGLKKAYAPYLDIIRRQKRLMSYAHLLEIGESSQRLAPMVDSLHKMGYEVEMNYSYLGNYLKITVDWSNALPSQTR